MHYTIRPATLQDVPFLARAIREAEAGGGGAATYERLFDLTETECLATLAAMLEEEIDGSELSVGAFLLAEDAANQPIAACAAWVEGAEGQPSSLLKAQLLHHTLGPERFRAAQPRLRLLAEVALERTQGALQLESFFTHPNARGKGIARQLIAAQLHRHPAARRAEIQLTTANAAARAAYARAGFAEQATRRHPSPELAHLLGADGKVLLARAIG
jgi:GNAT superfamily N-acetyltransferase